MRASDLVCSIRARIGDPTGVLVSSGTMLELLNSAMCEHAQIRPELYTQPKIVKLQEGAIQTPGCETVVSVDVLTSEDGTQEYGSLNTVNAGASKLFANRCASRTVGGQAVPSSASVDPKMPSQFKVQPPVGKGQDLWARIYCVVVPCTITSEKSELELSCKNFEDLITFTISKIYVPGDADLNAYTAVQRDYFYKANNLKRTIGYQIKKRGE
jgi:hypothetical protein